MDQGKTANDSDLDSTPDILAEVELYLAYQMAEQAIAVLEEALGEGVGGLEHRVRLIEIYAAEGNMDVALEHAKVALGQLGPEDEALRARVLAVDPEWSLLQQSVVEARGSGAAELALFEEPEPPDSGESDAPPVEGSLASGDPPAEVPAAADTDVYSEPPASPSEPQHLDDQHSRRSWRVPLIALGLLVGLAVAIAFVIQRSPVEAPRLAGLPESPVQGETTGGEAVHGAASRAAADSPAESVLPEFGTAVQMAGQVFFREDSTEVDARFGALLDDIAGTLVGNPSSFAEIVGYPGRAREAELDKAFARHFAWAVANQLIQRGAPRDHMRVESRTGTDLVADGWAIGDYDGLVVIHLGGTFSDALR